MRYSIINSTQEKVEQAGSSGIKVMKNSPIIFADLTEAQVQLLKESGASVEKVGEVRPPVYTPTPIPAVAKYTTEQVLEMLNIDAVRQMVSPPLYGDGVYVAVIGTGVRATHQLLGGKVVLSKNYTVNAPGDGFDHDTGVASIIHAFAPEAGIIDMKVMGTDGSGSSESVVEALDDCMGMYLSNDPLTPSIINMSLGAPDDGNPNDPMRVACRKTAELGMWLTVSAGNAGPNTGTITSPACERDVPCVGSINPETLQVSSFSSRGPTLEGLVKPDVVFPGEDMMMASSASDVATVSKSGTSFSCPLAAGMATLLKEGIVRRATAEFVPGSIDYSKAYVMTQDQLINDFIPLISVKPQGSSVSKDNEYGYGMPFSVLVQQVLSRAQVTGVDMSTMVSGIMMIGMVGMMMKGMSSAMVKR